MSRSRCTLPPLAVGIATLALCLPAGCGRGPDGPPPPPPETVEDPLAQAREATSMATETAGYRDALQHVNRYLADHTDALARQEPTAKDLPALDKLLQGRAVPETERKDAKALYRRLLVERVGLRDDELQEIESARFSALDAHHLEFCVTLRAAARVLRLNEPGGGARLDQVRQAFDWVMRHVALEETGGPLEPPEFALRRGHGGARERALVFLAMLAQMGVDGCVVACPGKEKDSAHYPLAGALVDGKGGADVYLFDPRLGIPLPAPGGKGVATFAQFRDRPEEIVGPLRLDKAYAYDVTAEQAKQARVEVVLPLSAVAGRMRFLEEDVFAGHDRIVLARRPDRLLARFEAAVGGAVGVSNRRGEPNNPPPESPTRVLRQSLPLTEGGVDGGARYRQHLGDLMPWAPVLAVLDDLGIAEALPGDAGANQIRGIISELFRRYVQVPREQLVRGRVDEAAKRLDRLQAVVGEYDDARGRMTDAEFAQKLGEWLARVKKAAVLKAQGGDSRAWEQAFGEDEYLGSLLKGGEDEIDRRKLRTGMLGHVVFRAAGEMLRKEIRYLQALRLTEKAARAEGRFHAVRDGGAAGAKRLEADASSAWENAQAGWGGYAFDYPLSPETFKKRVVDIYRAADPDQKIGGVRYLFRDLRRALAARLLQAEALVHAGQARRAQAALDGLQKQAEAAAGSKELQLMREGFLANLQQPARQALDTALFGDLAPAGTVFWMRYRARLEAARLDSKGG